MFYEEKWRHGWLWWRGTPNGEWRCATETHMVKRLRELVGDAADEMERLGEVVGDSVDVGMLSILREAAPSRGSKRRPGS